MVAVFSIIQNFGRHFTVKVQRSYRGAQWHDFRLQLFAHIRTEGRMVAVIIDARGFYVLAFYLSNPSNIMFKNLEPTVSRILELTGNNQANCMAMLSNKTFISNTPSLHPRLPSLTVSATNSKQESGNKNCKRVEKFAYLVGVPKYVWKPVFQASPSL